MTRITMGERRISARGHAGYAGYGQDIVCAGISALMLTLIQMLERKGIKAREYIDWDAGIIEVEAQEENEECGLIFETIREGLKGIAESYPGYAEIKQEE